MEVTSNEYIQELLFLYNQSEEMFKKTSHLLGGLHSQICKEFQYISRPIIETLSEFDIEKIIQAKHAIKIIINDCVDALIKEAKIAILELYEEYPNLTVTQFYNEYQVGTFDEFKLALMRIDEKVEYTRSNREQRERIYYDEIYKTSDFAKVIEFLRQLPRLKEDMRIAYLNQITVAQTQLKSSNIPKYALGLSIILTVCAVASLILNAIYTWKVFQ